LIRYHEGYVEDPAELEAIEQAIDTDTETRLRFLMIADDFATAGLEDEEPGDVERGDVEPGKVKNRNLRPDDVKVTPPWIRQVEEILVLTREFEDGREPKVGLAFEDERWRSLGGYAAYAPLARAEAEPRIRKRQPVEYSLGVIRVHDLVENIPYGVVKIVLLTTKETADNPKRMVGGFLVAIPRESPTGEDANYRFARLIAANYLNAAINPLEVEVRAIAARDNDSLAMFPASQVRALLEQQSPPLDDELRGSIQRLLDRLESKESKESKS
jgi:hypothetical protein